MLLIFFLYIIVKYFIVIGNKANISFAVFYCHIPTFG